MNGNPKDEKYLKICFVCSEEAKAGKEHLKNYGGIVCFSCRAFWRRSHQATKNPVLYCKRNGNCKLTKESRRHCKKCRYQRCLLAGMKPEAVLDPEQKKIHFRKYYKRQERLSKLRKRKVNRVEKHSKSKNCVASPAKQVQLPQHKIVKIEERTPERRGFEVNDDFLNDIQSNNSPVEQNPAGFHAACENVNFSNFECPGFQLPQFSYAPSFGQIHCPAENLCQSRVQLPDLDDLHPENLFFWNSMDFLN